MIFQAYLLGDEDTLVPIGEKFTARTSLDAVNHARELFPGLCPVVSEVRITEGTYVQG